MSRAANKPPRNLSEISYSSPRWLVGTFYVLLSAWTLVSGVMLGSRAIAGNWTGLGQWAMVAFVVAYTWFFSVGISYRASLDPEGNLVLVSLRRVVHISASEVPLVEGPHAPWGFLRLRLPREKGYLFCRTGDDNLHRLLWRLSQINPEMKFKNIEVRMVRD